MAAEKCSGRKPTPQGFHSPQEVEVRKQGFFLLSGKALTLRDEPSELTFTLNHARELHEQVQVARGSAKLLAFSRLCQPESGPRKEIRIPRYVWAARVAAVNALGRSNPDTVVNNIDAPNFARFSGGQGRALTARVRFVGRKQH